MEQRFKAPVVRVPARRRFGPRTRHGRECAAIAKVLRPRASVRCYPITARTVTAPWRYGRYHGTIGGRQNPRLSEHAHACPSAHTVAAFRSSPIGLIGEAHRFCKRANHCPTRHSGKRTRDARWLMTHLRPELFTENWRLGSNSNCNPTGTDGLRFDVPI